MKSSLTDWIQASAAVFAALGLIMTLILQWKTQKDQSGMLWLEQERDRRSILPYFELLATYQEIEKTFLLEFICKDNPMKLIFVQPINSKFDSIYSILNYLSVGKSIYLSIPEALINELSKNNIGTINTHDVQFFDKDSRPYFRHRRVSRRGPCGGK